MEENEFEEDFETTKNILRRIYDPENCIVICGSISDFSGYCNTAKGYPLVVNDVEIATSEALYQACRFSRYPEIQKKIIEQEDFLEAKGENEKSEKGFCRPDWHLFRIRIMRWCLRVKLLQNWENFGRLLLASGDRQIVEKSTKNDSFWGTTEIAGKDLDGLLVGRNIMGRLLFELRENLKSGNDPTSENFRILKPLQIEDFLLYGEPIRDIMRR